MNSGFNLQLLYPSDIRCGNTDAIGDGVVASFDLESDQANEPVGRDLTEQAK